MSTPPDVPSDDPAAHRPAPGWYDDPANPGRPRWWDGQRWAPSTAPPPGPGWSPAQSTLRQNQPLDLDIAQEQRSGRRARWMVILGLVGYGARGIVTALVLHSSISYLRDVFDAANSGRRVPVQPAPTGDLVYLNLLSNLMAIVSLAAGIAFLVWFYRSVINARALGLTQRLSPTWAILGFILPVIQWWFPWWSAKDLFPEGHEGRRLVTRWWLCWLGGQLVLLAAILVNFVSLGAAVAVACVSAAFYVAAAVLARSMITAAGNVHQALAADAGNAGQLGTYGMTGAVPAAPVDPWAKAAERREDPWANP
jgi:cobalamin synthase